MMLGMTLGELVNGASGVLFILTGVAVVALARSRPTVQLLGVTFALWGLNHALVFVSDVYLSANLRLVASGCLFPLAILVAWRYPAPPRAGERVRLSALLALVLSWVALALGQDLWRGAGYEGLVHYPTGPGLPTALSLGATAYLSAAFALRALAAPEHAPRLAHLSLALGLYSAFNAGRVIVMLIDSAGSAPADAYLYLGLTLLPAPLWLIALERKAAPRLARNVAIALSAAACTGAGITAVLGTAQASQFGIPGALRTLTWGILALAILRHDLLERALPDRAASRGSIATAALAALFIVAQIAQEFLSATYGLLMGGVVAGALLFAANPIQRAMERVAQGSPVKSQPEGARSLAVAGADEAGKREEIFRNALRVALRDKRLTREEEVHLHRMAEELGIGAGRAHEILVETEAEAEAR